MGAFHFLGCLFILFLLPQLRFKIYFYLWRRSSNETLWDQETKKQSDLKELVTETQFALQSTSWRWWDIQQRVPNCCERKCGRLTEPLQITVIWLSKSEIGGRKSCWRKCISTGGKGICRSSWRKWMRYPRRLRVPSLNKIAQTAVRPSPLWEFRAANCFRDFIVAWQNENLRWSGLSYLSRITGIRRSVAKGFCVSGFCPLECKRIRLASLRWFSDEANY